jgi:acetylornithine deacetylase/succinyl-diaminopimelate desuccinylase-like protein
MLPCGVPLAVLLLVPPAHPEASPYGEEAVRLLGSYLKIDTTNPPGQELKTALFLKELLEKEGVPVVVDEFAPGRANLLATLKGSGAKRAVVLAGHMDVVPAEASRWTVPPFSGEVRGGLLYGRGAQDMKDETIIHLLTLLRLKREGVALDRDVLFLATADEESGLSGAVRAASPEGFLRALEGAEYLVTEGGEARLGEHGEPALFSVDAAEKAPFWLTVRAKGTPGHASEPLPESAPNRLVRALDRIRLYKTPLRVVPVVEGYLRDQADRVGGERAKWFRDIRAAIARPEVAAALSEDRTVAPLLRDTISLTVLRAGYKTNVIPATAEAELDVRLLPGGDPQAFLRQLREIVGDPNVEIVPNAAYFEPNASRTDTELFRILSAVVKGHYPRALVTPSLIMGATESVIYRKLGITCYGFTPLLATEEELNSQHGDDERVQVSSLETATDIFYEVMLELCRR